MQFNQDDNVKGQLLSFYVNKGEIELDELDLPNNQVSIKSVILERPLVKVVEKTKMIEVK